jgi:hypothetical protein
MMCEDEPAVWHVVGGGARERGTDAVAATLAPHCLVLDSPAMTPVSTYDLGEEEEMIEKKERSHLNGRMDCPVGDGKDKNSLSILYWYPKWYNA